MLKLSSVSVSGFRSFLASEVRLGDLNVLIGANGAGKTNFIDLLEMLRIWPAPSPSLQNYVGRKGGASSILHYGPKLTEAMLLTLKWASITSATTYELEGALSFAAPDRLIFTKCFVRWRDEEGQSHSFGVPHPADESGLGSLAAETHLIPGQGPAAVIAGFLSGVQVYHFHDTSDAARIRTTQDLHQNRMLLGSGGNLAAYLYMLAQQHPKHYERIVSTVRMVVPYFRGFILAPDRLNTNKISLRWHDGDPDYEFGVHQLSDGSLRAVALITALLQPEAHLPSMLVLDEPELGLHPSAVATIAKLTRAVSNKRQVVVATQSPKFVSAFAPEEVAVVERAEGDRQRGHSVIRRLDAQGLGAWLQDYDLGQLYDMGVTGGGPG
ncbi:MAG: AAA family ATPase [Planctomycetota bacterium]